MSTSTMLRRVALVGPRLAAPAGQPPSEEFAWLAMLSAAYQGRKRTDRSLVNSTFGLRVLLQDATTSAVHVAAGGVDGDIRMNVPRLLAGNLHPRPYQDNGKTIRSQLRIPGNGPAYELRAPIPEDTPDADLDPKGFFTIGVTPVDPWPTPQQTVHIEMPRLGLAEHRMRVLVSAKGGTLAKPLGFLRLATIPGDRAFVAAFVPKVPTGIADPRRLPRIELPVVLVGTGASAEPFVALELTAQGIEFQANVANPAKILGKAEAPDRLDVMLRLVNSTAPFAPGGTAWSLELVREESELGSVRSALRTIRDGFRPGDGKPVFLDINIDAEPLPVRWPLEQLDGISVALPSGRAEDWQLWVEGPALAAQLVGEPVRGRELQTTVKLLPDRLTVAASNGAVTVVVDVDRRDPVNRTVAVDRISGPEVEIGWAPQARALAIRNAERKDRAEWFLDQAALARDLVGRYMKAGVHPPAADMTYAYLPVVGGWLQLPIVPPSPPQDAPEMAAPPAKSGRDAVPFDGRFEFTIPEPSTPGPTGRRLSVSAADYVQAQATFKNGSVASITLTMRGAAGSVEGLLWMAVGSPTPENVLPGVAAGPAALVGQPLRFQRQTTVALTLAPITSEAFVAGRSLKLTLPQLKETLTAYLWQAYPDLPMVTAVPLTRTVEGSGRPSETRGLLCREIDRKTFAIELSCPNDGGVPVLGLGGQDPYELPLLGKDAQSRIPLAAVTAPGIEFKPASAAFPRLMVSLSYGLPILDEYVANVRLPEPAPVTPADSAKPRPRPPTAPTSLDIPALTEAWRRAANRLELSRVQMSYALKDQPQRVGQIEVGTLFGGTAWKTDFRFDASAKVGGRTCALGTFTLDGQAYAGDAALRGLTKAFRIDGEKLVGADATTRDPLLVAGFAAAAWSDPSRLYRDSAGGLSGPLPAAVKFRGQPAGLVQRDIRIVRPPNGFNGWTATAAAAIPIDPPPGNPGRAFALWFRDLPLQLDKAGRRRFAPASGDLELARGPLQSGYDAERLPRSLYEWRLCNDPAGDASGPSAYNLAIGPFRFRPLRLADLTITGTDDLSLAGATVIGSLSAFGQSAESKRGPFGPEPDYQTGNLVAITLSGRGQSGLTFADADWRRARVLKGEVTLDGSPTVSFRRSKVAVLPGPGRASSGDTTMRVDLTFDKKASPEGLPVFTSAVLDTVLFGRRVRYANGRVNYDKKSDGGNPSEVSGLRISFTPTPSGAGKATGFDLRSVTVIWPVEGEPHMELDAQLHVRADDGADADVKATTREVVWQRLGGDLCWLNLAIPESAVAVKADHHRGVVTIDATWHEDGPSQEPIAGLAAKIPDIRAKLVLAIIPGGGTPTAESWFGSESGFGGLDLRAKDGAVQRVDHILVARDRPEGGWTSRLELDLTLSLRDSRIHWPTGSFPTELEPKSGELETLASRVSGRVLSGKIKPYGTEETLRHRISATVTGQAVPMSALALTAAADGSNRRLALAGPWSFMALVSHTIITSGEEVAKAQWTTLDHVTAVDARDLLRSAQAAIDVPKKALEGSYAFAARYQKTDRPETSDEVRAAAKAGLVLRAFAQAGFPVEALARHLVEGMFKGGTLIESAVGDGVVITGAGVTAVTTAHREEKPFWPVGKENKPGQDPQGVLLALPWLTTADPDYDFRPPTPAGGAEPAKKLEAFYQAPQDALATWRAPDIDWAAGSPMPLGRQAALLEFPGSGSARDLDAMMMRLRRGEPALPPSVPVEQVFLRSGGSPGPVTRQPLWLRSLMALRTVLGKGPQPAFVDPTMLVPVAPGRIARVRLAPAKVEPAVSGPSAAIDLIAIDRNSTRIERLPASDDIFLAAKGRARLVAQAERLVKEPVALLVAASAEAWPDRWFAIDVPADLDDATLDLPITLAEGDRLYASSALGWPTAKGTARAAGGALGLGEDMPFQDIPAERDPDAGEVRAFGSGLAGRATTLSLPARADPGEPSTGETATKRVATRAPVFVALGRKVIFDRPLSEKVPVIAPPARHLSPTEARVVVPVAADLTDALSRVVQGEAAPIVPPFMERISFGLRPGAMQAEFDMLLCTGCQVGGDPADEAMDQNFSRFGRPGHAGPRLLRQHRAPRAPELPRLPAQHVISHGRRTFAALDELLADGKTAAPFLLLEGVGTVLHHRPESQSVRVRVLGEPDAGDGGSVRPLPLQPEWGGSLVLHLSSRSHPDGGPALAGALTAMGILRDGARASLLIDGWVVPFVKARWDQDSDHTVVAEAAGPEGLPRKGIRLTLQAENTIGVQGRLDAVDGDSQVLLAIQGAPYVDNWTRPPDGEANPAPESPGRQRWDLDIRPKDGAALQEEPVHRFTLRLPVRPSSRPSLPVNTSTLIFADPSYDRELSGWGAAGPRRDKDGQQWKLALDRFEYGMDTPLYFAVGQIDEGSGRFFKYDSARKDPADQVPPEVTVKFERQPARRDCALQPLMLVGSPSGVLTIKASQAYGVGFDGFVSETGHRVTFEEGDEIVVSVKPPARLGGDPVVVRARFLGRPVIAPPSATYSLVTLEGDKAARVALHATGPLPQRISFPDLLGDLAVGHIRRMALFVWTTSQPSAARTSGATLVKVDRSGGGQMPAYESDIQPLVKLPVGSSTA